ncbi:hypothetical protein HDV05_005432 [Chytridiales sp. JEL 0842]|nr:hypothetical protein HDV05_005432 [Chytridiales sp. JEL 0842]
MIMTSPNTNNDHSFTISRPSPLHTLFSRFTYPFTSFFTALFPPSLSPSAPTAETLPALVSHSQLPQPPLKIIVLARQAYPQITGASLNTLSRACTLSKLGHDVLLLQPRPQDDVSQRQFYPGAQVISGIHEQVSMCWTYLLREFPSTDPSNNVIHDSYHQAQRAGFTAHSHTPFRFDMSTDKKGSLTVGMYPAYFWKEFQMVLPRSDLYTHLPSADLLIVEEPEGLIIHPFVRLNAITIASPTGKRVRKFKKVLGISHTSYATLAKTDKHFVNRLLAPVYAVLFRYVKLLNLDYLLGADRNLLAAYAGLVQEMNTNGINAGYFQR